MLSLVDQQGRTALHYAAVTEESGHYYKLLVNAGADPSAKDKVCRTKRALYRTNRHDVLLNTSFNGRVTHVGPKRHNSSWFKALRRFASSVTSW